jgi:hypothetical protein
VVEGGRVYVPPRLFMRLQEVGVGGMSDWEKNEEIVRLLSLTVKERILAARGMELVVDYEMESDVGGPQIVGA